MEALVDVGAASRLTNGVEIALTQLRFQRVDRFEVGAAFAQPVGETWLDSGLRSGASGLDLEERVQWVQL